MMRINNKGMSYTSPIDDKLLARHMRLSTKEKTAITDFMQKLTSDGATYDELKALNKVLRHYYLHITPDSILFVRKTFLVRLALLLGKLKNRRFEGVVIAS